MAKTKTAACGCVVEAEGDMDMVKYCDQHRPAHTVGMYVCICGGAFSTFEQLQEHAYNTDCLFPEVEGQVAA